MVNMPQPMSRQEEPATEQKTFFVGLKKRHRAFCGNARTVPIVHFLLVPLVMDAVAASAVSLLTTDVSWSELTGRPKRRLSIPVRVLCRRSNAV